MCPRFIRRGLPPGFRLREAADALADMELAAINAKWARYAGLPMIRMRC